MTAFTPEPRPAGVAHPSATLTEPNPPLPPIRLSRGARRTLAALTLTVCPPAPVVPDLTGRVAAFAVSYLPYLPPLTRRLFPVGLWLFEWSTILFGFALRPFSRLGAEARARYFASWQRSRFPLKRQLAKGMKAVVLFAYFDLPEVKSHLGYEPNAFVEALVSARAQRYYQSGREPVVEPHAPPPRASALDAPAVGTRSPESGHGHPRGPSDAAR